MKLHNTINYPLLKQYILKQTKSFYLCKNKKHTNNLIASLGKTRLSSLSYIDTYKRYRLPHHYILDDDASE